MQPTEAADAQARDGVQRVVLAVLLEISWSSRFRAMVSREVLAGSRTLHPHAGAVTSRCSRGDFFDARDLVQVKYEMVRKTDVEDVPVAVAAAAFGFSR